jgi:hypothetical protein
MTPITVAGMLTAVGGWIFLPLGYPAAWVSWVFLEYVIGVVRLTSLVPFASIGW